MNELSERDTRSFHTAPCNIASFFFLLSRAFAMDRFAFLRATLSPRGEGACGDGQGGAKLLFAGASCFFDEDGRVLYFAPTKQASVCVCVCPCVCLGGVWWAAAECARGGWCGAVSAAHVLMRSLPVSSTERR